MADAKQEMRVSSSLTGLQPAIVAVTLGDQK